MRHNVIKLTLKLKYKTVKCRLLKKKKNTKHRFPLEDCNKFYKQLIINNASIHDLVLLSDKILNQIKI